jgi:uncharacterized protein YbaR (Trm112 family)
MENVVARLRIEVLVDCPHCDTLIDLLDESDTDGVNHDDDSYIIRQVFVTDRSWVEFELDEVTCSKCKGVFNVREVEW